MKREHVGAIMVGTISIIIVAGILIAFQPPPIPEFEWAVSENESFLYEVRTYGNTWGGIVSDDLQEKIHQMNGSTIRATITELPSLENVVAADSFAREIIHYPKITCIFENESSISQDVEVYLSEGLSGCTLPIGGWGIIASFFPNVEFSYSPSTEYLSSTLYDEYLYLQYLWHGDYDDSGGWWGDSSLIDGRPLSVLWQYGHQSQTIYIELTMIE